MVENSEPPGSLLIYKELTTKLRCVSCHGAIAKLVHILYAWKYHIYPALPEFSLREKQQFKNKAKEKKSDKILYNSFLCYLDSFNLHTS